MKIIYQYLFVFLSGILLLSSCCNEEDIYFRYPAEAVRYYDEHDTIRFYSEETQTYEKFVVCTNRELRDSDTPADRCEQTYYFISNLYECHKDSCANRSYFYLDVKPSYIRYLEFYNSVLIDEVFSDYFDSLITEKIVLLGHTYENTFYVTSHNFDSLIGIRFSLEFGVIQRQYANATFNLVNDEDK